MSGGEQQQQLPPAFWQNPAFCALFCDPYIEGSPLQKNHIIVSMMAIVEAGDRLISRGHASSAQLSMAMDAFKDCLNAAYAIEEASRQAENNDKLDPVEKALGDVVINRLCNRAPGNVVMVPCGWFGKKNNGTVVFLVERGRQPGSEGSLVVCNSGLHGIEYHPSVCTAGAKMKYKTCIRIDHIPDAKLTDPAFWTVTQALWSKGPSEYHREEVLYDVLLPWLVEPRTVDEAMRETMTTDPYAKFRTVRRAETSPLGSCLEALYYLLAKFGMSDADVARLRFALYDEFLHMAVEPLACLCVKNNLADGPTLTAVREMQLDKDPRGDRHALNYSEAVVPKKLTPTDVWLLQQGVKVFGTKASKEHDKQRLTTDGMTAAYRFTCVATSLINAVMVERPSKDLVEAGDNLPESLPGDLQQFSHSRFSFPQAGLLEFSDTKKYAGSSEVPKRKLAADFLSLPRVIRTANDAVNAFTGCVTVVNSLLQLCHESSISSRLALQYEGIELINSLFLELIPLPSPPDGSGDYVCEWIQDPAFGLGQRMSVLNSLYQISHLYGTMWQCIERPSREFDSQRALVAGCILCVCDAVLRTSLTSEEPVPLGTLLWEDEGYAISTTVCRDNRPYEELSEQFELTRPNDQIIRDTVLAYMRGMHNVCAIKILDFHQTDKFELNKYSGTMRFLRNMLERFGYPIIPLTRGGPVPTEMEALTNWLFDERSQLIAEHPEVRHLRDIVFLFKYLTTMETRSTSMLRRRDQETDSWRLTFDEQEGSRYGFRYMIGQGSDIQFEPITWEILNFRGAEMHIADIAARGFGGMELQIGESCVTQSPSDLSLLAKDVHAERITEDDIIHADSLPTFGGVLSREESESLLSFLTVDYTRIPLVLGFFASHDRATYLFDVQLRSLLHSVLFEPRHWVPDFAALKKVEEVPLRKSDLQHREHVMDAMMDARIELETKASSVLGTNIGLLLNELLHSPEASLRPLYEIVSHLVKDLSNSSVYSNDAACLLSLVLFIVDADSYINKALQLKRAEVQQQESKNAKVPEAERNPIDDRVSPVLTKYHKIYSELLQVTIEPMFCRWITEAEADGDIVTACVIHGYRALLWSNMQPNEVSVDAFSKMFGSIAYVRNWHGFGMGQNRSDLIWSSDELSSVGTAEERFCRFLQAYGIDTRKLSPRVIQNYIQSSSTKPMFLHVGGQVVRCPRLLTKGILASELEQGREGAEGGAEGEGEKLKIARVPPADVPESRLFRLLQAHRAPLVFWLESVPQDTLDNSMIECVRTALRDKHFAISGWRRIGSGRFFAERAEVTVDVQTGEILWRNNQLKPVPDSMTQYHDFETLFGREPLHCGLVSRSSHRMWVHVIGTDFDLQEWDAPNPKNQGVGVPTLIPAAEEKKKDEPPKAPFVCRKCGSVGGSCWECPICTFLNCARSGKSDICEMCQQKNPNAKPQISPEELEAREMDHPPDIDPKRALFEGVRYTRELNLYSKEPHDQPTEQWVIDTLKPVILALFPPIKPLPYPLLLSDTPLVDGCKECHLIGCEDADKNTATWREFVVYKRGTDADPITYFEVYTLVSHGRRMWKSLCFTSNSMYSLHSMQPIATAGSPIPSSLLHAAGDMTKKRVISGSLVVLRLNLRTETRDYYVPPRLLQGVIPDALLESYRFWQNDTSGMIVGEALDTNNQESAALGTKIIVEIRKETAHAAITRCKDSMISSLSSTSSFFRTALERSSSSLVHVDAPVSEADAQNDLVKELMPLGFSKNACMLALTKNGMNVSYAASWLLDDANATEIILADITAAANTSKEVSEEARKQALLDDGYQPNSVAYALRLFGGDEELARGWLDDPQNRLQILRLDPERSESPAKKKPHTSISAENAVLELPKDDSEDQSSAPAAAGGATAAAATAGSASSFLYDSSTMLLIDVRNKESFALSLLLSRVEDMSHVLVWGHADESGAAGDDGIIVTCVELPRLKLRFHVTRTPTGTGTRLSLSDHDGWFVSSRVTKQNTDQGMDFFVSLLKSLPHSLVLENDAQQYRVLVPNHDPFCPVLSENPFSTALVFDRGSMVWKEAMDMPFFMYTIHPSLTFLVGPTLSSRLYLALLQMLTHQYTAAFEMIDSCTVDTQFTSDEKHVFEQFERTLPDRNPDAHACRLKLVLSVLYGRDRPEWETLPELNGYLRKLSHVSRSCRLTAKEELDVMHSCKSANDLVKNRREYILKVVALEPSAAATEVLLKPSLPKIGGMPWMKTQAYSGEYIANHGKNVKMMRYDKPTNDRYEGVKFLEILWDNHFLMDDVSGTTRHLGFCFLYNVLRNVTPITICGGRNITQSMGEIMTRWFHLKHCRWGKDIPQGDETEVELLLELQLLCYMAADRTRIAQGLVPVAPLDSLPAIPSDRMTNMLLHSGIHFFGRQAKDTAIKTWFEALLALSRAFATSPAHTDSVMRCLAAQNAARELPAGLQAPIPVVPRSRREDRPSTGNTGCSNRVLVPGSDALTAELFAAYTSTPLVSLCGADVVEWCDDSDAVSGEMPFNVDFHPAARPSVAHEMVSRMADDLKLHGRESAVRKVPVMRGMSVKDVEKLVSDGLRGDLSLQKAAIDLVGRVSEALMNIEREESMAIATAARKIVADANSVAITRLDQIDRIKFVLRRISGLESEITLDHVTRLVISTTFNDDLLSVNPFFALAAADSDLAKQVCIMMLRTSRASQAKRALFQCSVLFKLLCSIPRLAHASTASLVSQVQTLRDKINFASSALAELLTCKRYYMHASDAGASFAPRYLLFEYVFDIMLRERQVHIVEDFVRSCKTGESHVQQMIMGAGKTTVVSPLLSLILADGESMVVQVMPTALLEQTRNILRNCFSTIVKKQIFTLEFDRGVEDGTEAVAEKYAKLSTACACRGIVCAAPETIKSLMLKFVEQSHAIESFDFSLLCVESDSTRDARNMMRLRDAMIARSEMADALVKILDLWKKSILIMDEVDVLLHPLRSELNFPVGDKQAIDLSGFRWDLPIHLIDAVFYASANPTDGPRKRLVCGPEQFERFVAVGKQPSIGIDAVAVLHDLGEAIRRGYEAHLIQAVPHLVMLDPQFYEHEIKHLIAQWAMLWLATQFVENDMKGGKATTTMLIEYLMGHDCVAKKPAIETALMPDSLKLLNLAQDWVCHLLPHVLAKIDRVSYGLLSTAELAAADPRTPQSRLLMAIPFVGKDVPSRSSEFAHPDAVIGLTILAYRYEGLRRSDMQRLLMQLKQDYSRQVGPRDQRPASVLLQSWLNLAASGDAAAAGLAAGVLPLALLQPADKKQLMHIFTLLRKVPEVICYYLRQHVFPACMNFQKMKMSACGHELGSDILFGKRIGFSGTPSNLLPVDLGSCQYEPCSDGRILSVLTSPKVVTATVKKTWDAKSLLRDICEANRRSSGGRSSHSFMDDRPLSSSDCLPPGPIHALIDTGALITGMDNEEVADYLVRMLPDWMEGVVYLDKSDRQMVKLRGTGVSVQLAQCGIPPEKRFTFYDQVHTTGMDIKQFSSARAVLTLGKDMTFRDYAQGAYRMRGIGRGMTIDLCIIPEVRTKIANELGTHATGKYEIDVPAWLLINSMRMETLQFVKMGSQELMNSWRKRALASLLDEVHTNRTPQSLEMHRLRRFVSDKLSPEQKEWLRKCVSIFREPVSYQIPSNVPVSVPYAERLQETVKEYSAFTEGDEVVAKRVQNIVKRLTEAMEMQQQQAEAQGTVVDDGGRGMELNAEVVHEQEAQEEEEAEEEAEEEEQKMSQFSRDDEQQNPWPVVSLGTVPAGEITDAFYRLSLFHVKAEQPCMSFPNNMLVTDNFFRPTWIGFGQRRLKNAHVFMELIPRQGNSLIEIQLAAFLKQLTTGCGNAQCAHRLCASNEDGRKLIQQMFAGATPDAIAEPVKKMLESTTMKFADPHHCAMFFCPTTCDAIAKQIQEQQQRDGERNRYCVALSLAEAETLRMMLHKGHPILSVAAVAVYDIDASALDSSANYISQPKSEEGASTLVERMSASMKFINCEMYYTDSELVQMQRLLEPCSYASRVAFFNECLGVRNRERHLWGDTPIVKLLAPPSEWQEMTIHVLFEQARAAIVHALKLKAIDPYAVFGRFSSSSSHSDSSSMSDSSSGSSEERGITYEQFGRYFEAMRLGFSPANCNDIVRHIDREHTGVVTMSQIVSTLNLPSRDEVEAAIHEHALRRQMREALRGVKAGYWQCKVCTFVNSSDNTTCVVCDCDMAGHRGCPPDKWVCSPDKGGCTYFNPKTLFYCEMCGRARPDLSSVRLL